MEQIRNFTFNESFNRDELLEEALEIVRCADIPMGDTKKEIIEEGKAKTINQIEKLQKEQAKFSPRLDVIPLTNKNFQQRGIEPSDDLKARMKYNHLYLIQIPVTLFPLSGWAFTRLECWIEFCPDEEDANQRPIIHEIFPEDVWREILTFEDSLNLGLDENLAFRAEVEKLAGKWQKLSANTQAKIAANLGGKANLVVGPFSYRIRRAEILGRGRKNVEAFWRLDGNQHVQQEDVLLGVVLTVPKTRKQPVHAIGKLQAYHNFQISKADIFQDHLPHFSDLLKSWLGKGAPVNHEESWVKITN